MPSINLPVVSGAVESASSAADLGQVAARLAQIARDTAVESERNRRVSPELLEVLRNEGLGGMAVPSAVGGRDIDPPTVLGLIETVSAGDGSAGWVTMIYLTSSVAGHYLDSAGLAEVFASGSSSLTSGVLAPRGTAKRVDGGYIVAGTWPFASGCIDASWISVGAMVDESARLSFFLPRNEVGIVDTWDVMGLRATASHDVTVDNRFVPDSRVFDLSGPSRTQETIARFPVFGLLAAGIGAVSLGIARAAIDEAADLAGAKVPTGSKRRLIDRPAVQEAMARAETMVAAARCYLFALAEPGPSVSIEDRARLRMAATFAVSMSREAVQLMYTAAGGSSLYTRSPLQRHFRDIHAATQHMMVAQPTWELGAKALLGIESDTSSL
ncbi:MAG TPA: acyl-CoA dehydrogenase family protein [Acidimicrobiia bacterium]|nr:acyl-CoA dehydrogenase family protein [Acidimicrobiia bacterium]